MRSDDGIHAVYLHPHFAGRDEADPHTARLGVPYVVAARFKKDYVAIDAIGDLDGLVGV